MNPTAKKRFIELLAKLKTKRKIDKETEILLWFFFRAGFKEGSSMTQLIA